MTRKFILLLKEIQSGLKLTRGLLYYYGTLNINTLIEMVEKYTGETLSLRKYLDVVHEAKAYRQRDIHMDEEGFSDSRISDPKRVKMEHQSRRNLKFNPFTKQQLLTAGVPDFVERNKSYLQFVNFLYDMTKKEADELVEEWVYATRIGHGTNDVMQFLSHSLEFKDLKAVQALTDHLVHLMKNTREWFLKDHISEELLAEERNQLRPLPSKGAVSSQPSEVVKVGRNDPCPCGSRKKYKKCCAR